MPMALWDPLGQRPMVPKLEEETGGRIDDWITSMLYFNTASLAQAAMVKLVDTLVLGTNANASRFESEWRHQLFP